MKCWFIRKFVKLNELAMESIEIETKYNFEIKRDLEQMNA